MPVFIEMRYVFFYKEIWYLEKNIPITQGLKYQTQLVRVRLNKEKKQAREKYVVGDQRALTPKRPGNAGHVTKFGIPSHGAEFSHVRVTPVETWKFPYTHIYTYIVVK